MKNFNLIKRLWKTDSHEKQSPQRFARYAAMLIMLLTLGVGQMWGTDLYVRGERNSWGTSEKMDGTSSPWTYVSYWSYSDNKTFKIATDDWSTVNKGSATISAFGTKYKMLGTDNMTFPTVPTGGGVYKIIVTLESGDYYIQIDKLLEEESTWRDITAPKIYWDNTAAGYSNVSMLNGRYTNYGGQGAGSIAYTLTHIDNTNLWYTTDISNASGDASKYTTSVFINDAWDGWEGSLASERAAKYATNYTASNCISLNSDTYLFSAGSGSNKATLTGTKKTSGWSDLNYTQTLNQELSTDGGSSYSTSTLSLATVSVSAYKLKNATTAESSSGTIAAASSSTSCVAAHNNTVTYTVSSVATGYAFVGWYEGVAQKSTSTTYTYRATAAKTVKARFKENQYTVSRYASGSVTGGSFTAASPAGQITGGNVVATPSTGYHFSSWSVTSGTGSFGSTTTASTKFYPTSNATVKATFAPNEYEITLDKNEGDSDGSATATYLDDDLVSFSGASRTGYSCDGYFDDPDDGEGNMIIDASGNLQLNQTGYTNASGWSKTTTPTTLYAHWTENVSNYTVTYAVKSDQTSLGTLSCATTVGGTSIDSGDEVAGGTGITFTAAPITGYEVDAWCSNAACTKPIAGAGYANTYALSLSKDTAVYVKFKKKVYTITYSPSSAPTGCTYTTKPLSGTYGNTVTMVFTPSTGYTVSVSAVDASSNTVTISNPSANTYTFTQPASAVTVTVSTSQIMSTLSTSCSYDAGDPEYADPTKSASSIGIATTSTLTATTPSTGYTFAGWTLSDNLVVTSGDEDTDLSITVRSNGNGAAATAQANYNEDVSTDWTLKGSFVDDFATAFDFEKKSGESTGSVAYTTLTLAAGTTYNFKVIKDGSTWYGNSGTMTSANCTDWTFTTAEGSNAGITTTSAGTYQFKIDFSGANPSVSVIYPPTLTWSATSVYSGNASTLTASVSNIVSSKTIKYDVYAGATATGDVVATWSGSTSSTTHSRALSVTPSFGASDVNKQYTVKVTYDGTRIATYTAYIGRKWDIYVHDVQSWGQMKLHMWNASGSKSTYPGDPCSLYNSSTSWYTVTLDGKYNSGFVLSADGDDTKTANHSMSISSFGAGTYWYVDKYKDGSLQSVSVSDPTVTLSATVTSTNQINLTGNVSNFGGDGTAASDMKEVYFKVNNTKDAASITVSTSNGNFTKTLNNPTPDNTNNTLQAFAENIHGTGYSSAIRFTNVTLDNQSATTAGTANVLAVNGANMASGATAPTKWGYNFGGYYASTGGSGKQYYNSSMGSANTWDQTTATKTIYAKWTVKSCTITLNNQGADSGKEGTSSQTTNYNTSTGLSTITCPQKTGYIFGGYYTAANGKGSQIIARNGSWNANVDTYMYSGNWVYDGGTTLYAWWIECAGYSFHYGTTDADDWAKTCFTQDGVTTTWKIENFAIPNKPNFFVGYQEEFYASGLGTGDTKSKSVERAWTDTYSEVSSTGQGQMKLLPGGYTVGQATGALGTITIDTDSKDYNLSVGFTPNGYGVTHNSGTHEFVTASSNWRETEVVTLTSGDVSGNFQVKLKTSSSWAATAHGVAENASAVNGRKITGDSNIANGLKGVFQMWTDAAANNFGLCFVTVHDVTFDMQGHGDAISKYTDVRYNSKISAPSDPSETGYTFGGWYKEEGCTNAWNFASDVVTAATTLYAKWTANEYVITLDLQTSDDGYGSGGDDDLTATYDAAFPSITLPTAANGYAFMGYWSEEGGEGTQFTDEDGVLLANIASYSDASGHWIYDGDDLTLYAYYKKAEITAITLDATTVESEGTVSFAVTINPTPTGTTKTCFTVLHSNDNPLAEQPTVTYSAGKYSFTAPAASGTYKIQAVLRTGSSCDGGDELDTEEANFQVAGLHSVTVRYKCGDEVIKAATTLEGIRPLDWSDEISAPEITGYRFTGWTAGDGVSLTDDDGANTKTTTTEADIKIKAIYDGYLTANYAKKRVIYFNNTLGWDNVYVYFYKNDSYWGTGDDDKKGTGANTTYTFTSTPYSEGKHGQMEPIEEGSKIYYFDAEEAGVNASYTTVVFTELDQHGFGYFAKTDGVKNKVIRRTDYYSTKMPMYVPLAVQTPEAMNGNLADYYWQGYWMNYPENTGYTLKIYNKVSGDPAPVELKSIPFEFTADMTMPMELNVDLEAGQTYGFKIWRNDGLNAGAGSFYGNGGTMTANTEGWDMQTDKANCGLQTTAAGNYKFLLNFYEVSSDYQYRVSVTYPVALGDYRIVYTDLATWSGATHTASWNHPSGVIAKNGSATETKKDTVSFFWAYGSTPAIGYQTCSELSAGSASWSAKTAISVSDYSSVLTSTGVYNFIFEQAANGASISLIKVEPYTGNYYIRTDAANSKWDNYRTDPDHLMTYSEYSIEHGGYSHYYTHWVQTDDRKNIKFTIANDFSPCISDTLIRENNVGDWANITYYIESNGDIKRNANVRFMWNQSTNKISRAYVDGAQGDNSANFLYILNTDATDKIRWSAESALTNHKVTFMDNGDWIYEANIQAQPNAQIRLLSNWGESSTITQYFKGSSSTSEDLVGGSGSTWYDIRVIYDFKTNRLVASYIPRGEIDDEIAINADVMFIREHQGDIDQLTFKEKDDKMGAISKIETAYGVLRLNKWTINNKDKSTHDPLSPLKSRYERDLFYVSFPFRVSMEEVFGFGTYGTHWIIEYYDGANRAANGYWLESGPNWKFVTNRKGKFFEPYQGYIIALDLDEMSESSSIWANAEQVELYFPSYGTMSDITNASVNCTIPEHLCTINRSEEIGGGGVPLGSAYDRRVKDSHWNVISVPTYVNTSNLTFANTDWITTADDEHVGPNFLYEWNPADNSVTARSGVGYTYQAMHAYLVQYCGIITWTSSVSPAAAPRRNPAYRGEYEFRLELQQNDVTVDQTFVKLSDNEAVTTGFEFNYDLSKEFNASKSNIYTLIGTEQAAGNVLPLTKQTTVVPVGVKAVTDGDYTFSMPDGTEGIGITLIDNETGIRTSLSALDYTIYLSAGTYESRFVLEISPIKPVATGIEDSDIRSQKSDVRKVMIDGLLYIVKDGKMFDARGAMIK